VKRLVLILTSVDTKETLERWTFDVDYEKDEKDKENFASESTKTDEKRIRLEIRDVIR